MAASASDYFIKVKENFSTTIGAGGVAGAGTTTIPLNSVSGLPTDTGIELVINRVDSNSTVTNNFETVRGTISGSNLINVVRGVEGTAQAWSAGVVVEYLATGDIQNRMVTGIVVEHNQDGTHQETALDSMIAGTEAQGDIIYHNGTIWTRLPKGNDGEVLTLASSNPSWAAASSGTAFWSDVPGTPTRVSDTQFTITDTSNANLYDLLFKKGVILKWLESTTFQTAMVISSSYGANTVTINIVGDSLTAGFTSMKFAIPMVNVETFIIPGSLATGTDLAKTWYVDQDVYILSADAYVKTAGTTNSTVFDINDDGTTKFTTKPTITTGTTSDINNVADNPSTAVSAGSLITIDIDSVSTTVPVEAYIKVFSYPVSWRYRN